MAKYVEHFLKIGLLISSFATISFAQVPQVQHVFIVLEENTDNGDVCGPGAASMPFLCSLKSQGSFSENYYAATHPSIGNYEDLAWGVVTTNDDSCDPNTCGFPYTGDNIVREVQAAGKTWKGYAENLPSTCYLGGDSGEYAVRHSPIPYISDVQSNCLNRYVAFEDPNLGFAHDLAQNTFPNYAFITPNLCDDGHDCTLPGSSVPDSWLQNNVLQPLLNSGHLDPTSGDTVVIVTFDESESDNTNGGGLIYWFMIGAGVKQNYQSTGPSTPPGYYSHESTLRVMAEMVGAGFSGLGGAANAPDMAEFFGTSQPLPVSVTVSPASVTVPSGSTQQFNPTVANTTNQAVTWSATAGTISAAGLFTAPVVSTNTTVTVTATSIAAPSQSGSATVTVQASAPLPISVAVSPASATVASGGTKQFTAITVNTNNQAVTWSATAGTISTAGLFTAPVVSSNTTVTVTATSVAASSQSGSATVTVQAPAPLPISVAVSPASITVPSGGTQQFKPTVANTTNQAVTWSATAGTISTAGLFTAPVVSSNTTVTVTATSVAASSQSGSATVSVQAPAPLPITVAVSPASITVPSGSTQQFKPTVANTTNQAVTWSATAGTISTAGLFTAPAVSSNTTVTVTATSVAASSQSGSATVTVQAPAPLPISVAVSSVSATVSSGATQQFSATVANTTNQAVTWKATTGTISATGLFTAPVVSTNTPVTVTATSVAAPSQSGSVTVTVQASALPTASVTVSPASAIVSSGGTARFTATMASTRRKAVTWTATGGTISSAGLFTAPVVSSNTTVTVTATSVAATSQSGSATVTVQASAPASAPATTVSQAVQHNSGSVPSASSVAVGFKSNVTAGDVLLVAQSTFDRDTLNTPVDSQGNTFSLVVTANYPKNSVASVYIATAKGTGPDTVTCSISTSTSDNIHCHIYEVTGVTAVVDAVGSALQVSEALSVSTSNGTTNASDYVFAYFASNNTGPTYAVGLGFGDPEQSDSPFTKSGYSDSGFSEDETVITTGVQTATATSSVTDSFTGLIVALKKSQTVAGPPPPPTAPTCALSVSPGSGPVPLQVTASANCTDPQNQLVSTVITWGDGSSTNGSSGSHSYVSANTFTVTVTATDSAMLTGSATQTVTATNLVSPPVSVAVAPASASVSSGGTQQFTTTVANTTNPAVTWNATAGTISATGLLTAPVVSTNTTVTVTATSVAASSQSAAATVQVLASGQPAPLSPSGPISINGQSGTVIENLHITNPNGDCVTVTNSTNIIIRSSEIGPCGGNGVHVSGGGTIAIYDSYIHPGTPLSTACCDTHDGIFANGTSQLSIQGNVIAYGEANIEVNNAATVVVTGNFLLNPIDSDPSQPADGQSRGQNIQAWSNSSNVTVQNNYALSSTDTTQYLFPENQEDSINFGLTNGVTASNNYITGGHSPSGCGLIADSGANSINFLSNILLNTGQCGIGIADGTNQLVDSNKILNQTPVSGGGNTALYVWKATSSDPACGPVTVSNNIAAEIRSDGTQSGFWNGGGCEPVTLTNNTFDAAAQILLEPVSQTMPPPQIPPEPKDCVVSSPYTNNTSLSPCTTN